MHQQKVPSATTHSILDYAIPNEQPRRYQCTKCGNARYIQALTAPQAHIHSNPRILTEVFACIIRVSFSRLFILHGLWRYRILVIVASLL